MDEGTPQGENGNPTNNAGTGDELERYRKEAEQAKMRANQLANELEAKRKTDEEAAEAKLKEQQEYKTLFEQKEAELAELKKADAEAKTMAKAKAAMDEIQKNYSTEALAIAEAAGISLTDASDEAVNSYKGRLEAIAAKVTSPSSPVRGNNPAPQVDTTPAKMELLETMKLPNQRGKSAAQAYIRDLSAVKQMKQMAGVEPQQ